MSSNLYQLTRVLEAPVISEKSTVAAEKDKQIVLRCNVMQLRSKLKVPSKQCLMSKLMPYVY